MTAPRSLIAVDPGYAEKGPGCACAQFISDRVVLVWFIKPREFHSATGASVVVYECPVVRPREDVSPGKANNLIRLAAVGAELAGRYAGRGGTVVAVEPHVWKGSTPKPVQHGRLWDELTEDERDVVRQAVGIDVALHIAEAKRRGGLDRWSKPGHTYYGSWTGHNLLDAVGIGRWYLAKGIR